MSGLTVTRTLKHGFKVGEELLKDVVLREAGTGDLFDAERDAPYGNPLAYNGALMARQLVRAGTFQGPFTLGMIRKLKPVDYAILRSAQLELIELGEAPPSADGGS